MVMSFLYFVALLILVALAVFKIIRTVARLPNIQNRPVFITGCDSGFGRLLAVNLDAKGIPVYAGCLQEKSAEDLKQCCSSRLKAICLDASNSESVRAAAEFIEKDLGQKALWAVVNNAGISGPMVPFEWTSKDDCRNTLEVNLLGMYDVILKFLPLIRRGKEGRIVNMASMLGRIAFEANTYIISKYAVEGLSDGLSYELDPFNITVHTIEPGGFKTPILEDTPQIKGIPSRLALAQEDIKQLYGGEEYLGRFVRNRMKVLQTGASHNLQTVVDDYEHALFSKYPQSRYQSGFAAKWMWAPLTFLPRGVQAIVLKGIFRVMPPTPKKAYKT